MRKGQQKWEYSNKYYHCNKCGYSHNNKSKTGRLHRKYEYEYI